jgi:uncharacterized protein (DUF302 family)
MRSDTIDQPRYAHVTVLKGLSFDEARQRVTAALADQGFGVLTEIDVQATLKEKLDAEFRPYVILGACNPQLAHRAFLAEPNIGVLLPCNVIVQETEDGAVVSAMNPRAMGGLLASAELEPLMAEVDDRMLAALAAVQGGGQ